MNRFKLFFAHPRIRALESRPRTGRAAVDLQSSCGVMASTNRYLADVWSEIQAHLHQRQEARRSRGEALTEIARTFGVGHSTFAALRGEFLTVALHKKPWRYSRGFSAEETSITYCQIPNAMCNRGEISFARSVSCSALTPADAGS